MGRLQTALKRLLFGPKGRHRKAVQVTVRLVITYLLWGSVIGATLMLGVLGLTLTIMDRVA